MTERRRPFRQALLLLALGCACRPLVAQTFTWNNPAGGTFGTAGNWTPAGPPTLSTQIARFDIPLSLFTVHLAADANFGTLVVSQGDIDFDAPGRTMTVSSDAVIAADAHVGWNSGTFTQPGGGDLEVNGALQATSGGFVRTDQLFVGLAGGSGFLTVIDGGTLHASGNVPHYIAFGNGSSGTLRFDGVTAGTINGGLNLIDPGLRGRARLISTLFANLTVGTMSVGNTTDFDGNFNALVTIDLDATIAQTGASSLTIGGATLGIVSSPSQQIIRSGQVAVGYLGRFISGTGPITVNPGGRLSLDSGTFLANGDLTALGTGRVDIAGGTLIGSAGRTLAINSVSRAWSGGLVIDEPGFESNGFISADALSVGGGTTGWARISGGTANFGSVTADGTLDLSGGTLTAAATTVGLALGSQGVATVSAARLNATTLIVGGGGSGSLSINPGGVVVGTGPITVSNTIFGTGYLRAGGSLDATAQPMTVGRLGAGTLEVVSGGTVSVATLNIGSTSGGFFGVGTAILNGGQLNATNVYVGTASNAVGRLIVNSGTLSAAAIDVAHTAALTIAGGTVNSNITSTGPIDMSGGRVGGAISSTGSTFNFSGGTVTSAVINAATMNLSGGRVLGSMINSSFLNFSAGTIGGGGSNSGTLDYTGGSLSGSFSNTGRFLVDVRLSASGATINNTGTMNFATSSLGDVGALNNNAGGLIIGTGGTARMDITNGGTITASGGTLIIGGASELVNSAGGLLRNLPSSTLSINTSTFTNFGGLEVNGGGGIFLLGKQLNIPAGQTLNMLGGILSLPATGTTSIASGGLLVGNGQLNTRLNNNLGGQITITGGSAVFSSAVINNGSMTVAAGSTAVFQGTFSGANGTSGGGSVQLMGGVRPGNSPASVSFGGDVVLGPVAAVQIELGGLVPGSQHDKLNIAGHVDLDGTIEVSLINSFLALPGDSFQVMTFGSKAGDVTVVNATGFAGLLFNKIYGANSLTLVADAMFDGDANLDARVDISDLLALATHYNMTSGQAWTTGDFTGDSAVNSADLAVLAGNWQAGAGGPGAILDAPLADLGALPEPAGVGALAGMLTLSLTRHRQGKPRPRRGHLDFTSQTR